MNLKTFLGIEIWNVRLRDIPLSRRVPVGVLRVLVLCGRGIEANQDMLKASALTFYALLSVVPILAMAFGLAKGFGFEEALEAHLLKVMPGQEEVVVRIVGFSRALLQDVKGGLMAVIGLATLLYAFIKILSHIENAFNAIWGVPEGRRLGRKIADYLAVLAIAPCLYAASSSLTLLITSGVQALLERGGLLRHLQGGASLLSAMLPLGLWGVLFSFLYLFLPNTRVSFTAGLLGGFVAGALYHLFQWAYITLQVGVSSYNAIYGSFAAIPLFFVWMQAGWVIVLFGAEVAHAYEDMERREYQEEGRALGPGARRLLALEILHWMVQRFAEAAPPVHARQIRDLLHLPADLTGETLLWLEEAGLIHEVKAGKEGRAAYLVAQDPDLLTLGYVLDALDAGKGGRIPGPPSRPRERLSLHLEALRQAVEKSEWNKRLKEI